MPTNASITNYFKPFAQSRLQKRPFPEDGSGEPRSVTRRMSPSSSTRRDQRNIQPSEQSVEQSFVDTGLRSSSQPSVSSRPKRSVLMPVPDHNALPTEPQHASPMPALKGITTSEAAPPSSPPPAADSTTTLTEPSHAVSMLTQDVPTSRLTTMPGSQPILTSSQRMVKNGEVMIRNSDDESSSEASFEDLNALLGRGRPSRQVSPQTDLQLLYPHAETQSDKEGTDKTNDRTGRAAHSSKPAPPPPSALRVLPKKYKLSLEALSKQRKQDDATKDDIAQAKSMLESYNRRMAPATKNDLSTEKRRTLDVDLIGSILKDHGDAHADDFVRFKTAILRTEALQHGKSWSFFDDSADEPLFEHTEFPDVEDDRLRRLFRKTSSRQQAFLSGYVGEYAMKGGLPEEIMLWIVTAVCLEPRDDLRYSYISTLTDAAKHFTALLTPGCIDILFRQLGATATAVDVEMPIVPLAALSQSVETTSRPSLLSILILLASVSGDMASQSRVHLLCTLCRLALDHTIVKNCHAISAIEGAFANLIESISEQNLECELQSVLTTAYRTIADACLRLQLLQTVPAWSSRLILFRQRLALAFFYQDSRYLSKQPKDLVNIKSITRRLQSPQFATNNSTDFSDLSASVSILNIGIACGHPPPSPFTKEDEVAFNKDVDSLASKISSMFNDIVDTGASHMKRTEVKEALEKLQRRLEYAVRTKPKPKKLIFGDSEVVKAGERIDRFLEKGEHSDLLALPRTAHSLAWEI